MGLSNGICKGHRGWNYNVSLVDAQPRFYITKNVTISETILICLLKSFQDKQPSIMPKVKLKAAVIIISDTAYQDPSTDKCASVLTDTFAIEGDDQWTLHRAILLPDDVSLIQTEIMELCRDGEEFANLIVTSGGTGFAVRDRTPEAVSGLLDRHATGLV